MLHFSEKYALWDARNLEFVMLCVLFIVLLVNRISQLVANEFLWDFLGRILLVPLSLEWVSPWKKQDIVFFVKKRIAWSSGLVSNRPCVRLFCLFSMVNAVDLLTVPWRGQHAFRPFVQRLMCLLKLLYSSTAGQCNCMDRHKMSQGKVVNKQFLHIAGISFFYTSRYILYFWARLLVYWKSTHCWLLYDYN